MVQLSCSIGESVEMPQPLAQWTQAAFSPRCELIEDQKCNFSGRRGCKAGGIRAGVAS